MQLEYFQRLIQWLSLTGSQQVEAGKGRSQGALGLLLTCPPDSVLVEAGLDAQLATSSAHLGKLRQLLTVGHFVVPNRLCRASHKQYLTWTCSRVPSNRPQNQHPVSFRQHQSRIQLAPQAASVMRGLGRCQPTEVNPISCGQRLCNSSPTEDGVGLYSEPAWRLTPSTNGPIVIKTQLQ